MNIIKVTAKGQVTLPRTLRKKLDIAEGAYLEASIFQNGILLKKAAGSSEMIREHCRQYQCDEEKLEKTRQILGKVPYSLSEQSSRLREE